jgi:hypothetical protein
MKRILLYISLLSFCVCRGQAFSVPDADLYAAKKLRLDFTQFDSNYVNKRGQRAARAKALVKKVFELESAGRNTACMHQILFEAGSLLFSTADFVLIDKRLDELDTAILHPETQLDTEKPDPSDGTWGKCYCQWYSKIVASFDHLEKIAGNNLKPTPFPSFLNKVNTSEKLKSYLLSIAISDIPRTGIDNEREYNDMLATLIQIIIRGRPMNYVVDSSLKDSLRNLLLQTLRNPITGWWGESYLRNGKVEFVDDLSITFHTISYFKGKVPDMDKVVSTVLSVKNLPYPVGWLWNNAYWNHNNMDIVTLFQYGWQKATVQQRNDMKIEIDSMLQWCLTKSLKADGSFPAIPPDGSVEEAQYYGISFLTRIGYFDPRKRFWTDQDFLESSQVKERLVAYIKKHQSTGGSGGDYYKSALEDLGYFSKSKK